MKGIFTFDNIGDLSPHSYWTLSASKAKNIDADVDEIIRRRSWQSRKNFLKFYEEKIMEHEPHATDYQRTCQK